MPPTEALQKALIHDIPTKDYVFLLDIDGVLCHAQQPVSVQMQRAVERLGVVYLVTGNTFIKAKDLIGDMRVHGIFCNSADELRTINGTLLWQDKDLPLLPSKIEDALLCDLRAVHFGNRIEWRGQRCLNFSHIGRNATLCQRENHDPSWREDTAHWLRTIYDMEVTLGGKISIDVAVKGANKSRAGAYTNSAGKWFVFIGDKTSQGGNDYPLVEYARGAGKNISLTTYGPEYTLELIEGVLA